MTALARISLPPTAECGGTTASPPSCEGTRSLRRPRTYTPPGGLGGGGVVPSVGCRARRRHKVPQDGMDTAEGCRNLTRPANPGPQPLVAGALGLPYDCHASSP